MGLSKASPGPSTSSAAAPAPPSSAWLLPLSLLTLALVLAGDDVGAAGLLSAPPTEVLAVRSASGEPSASPRLCASAAEMTVGEWSSSEDGGGAKGDHADRFLPAGCRLVEPGFDADGSLCAQLAALRIDALVFLGDSLAANLMLDLREGFFGEMSTEERPFGRQSCWASRKANFMSTGRGPCHDSEACGGALRISWMDAARPDNQSESPHPGAPAYPGVMRTNAYNFLGDFPLERVAVVVWFGACERFAVLYSRPATLFSPAPSISRSQVSIIYHTRSRAWTLAATSSTCCASSASAPPSSRLLSF